MLKKGSKEYAAAVAAYNASVNAKRSQINSIQQNLAQPVTPIQSGPLSGGGLVTPVGQADPVANAIANLVKGGSTVKSDKPEDTLGKFVNGGMDIGSRILDVLSRGTYASANTIKTMRDSKYADSTDIADGGKYIADIAKGAWRGLSGQDKTTYSDVLANGEKKTVGDGIGGFILDVGLDPTTYIGAGLVKAGIKAGAKGAEKLGVKGADKVVAKFSKNANEEAALAARNSPDPSSIKVNGKSAGFAPPAATTDVRLPDHMEPIGPGRQAETFNPVVDKAPKVANTAPAMDLSIPEMPKVERIPNIDRNKRINLAVADIARIKGDIEKARPSKYAEGTTVGAPFKDVEEIVNAPKAFDRAGIDKLSYRIAVLSDDKFPIMKGPDGKTIYTKDLGKWVEKFKASGNTAGLKSINDAVNRAVDAAIKSPEIKAHLDRVVKMDPNPDKRVDGAVSIFDSKGNPMGSQTPRSLARLLSGEDKMKRGMKVDDDVFGIDPSDIDNLHIRANSDGVPVPLRRLMDRVQGVVRGEDGKPVKSGTKTVKSQPLSGAELDAWKAEAAKIFDPADIQPLLNVKSAKAFEQALNKVVSGTKVKDFETPADLAEKLKGAETALERAKAEPEWLEKVAEATDDAGLSRVNAAASVPTAEEIIEDVAQNGPEVFNRTVTELSDVQSQAVADALSHFISRDMIAPLLGKDGEYKFTTRGGTKRTAEKLNEGLGRNVKQFNEFSQGATVANKLLSAAVGMLTPAERKLTDAARGAAIRKYAEPMMNAAWDALDARGIRSIGGLEDKGIALALPDVLKQFPDEIVNRYFYDAARQILPSVWIRIAKTMIEHPGSADLPKMVETAIKSKVGRSGGGATNPIVAKTGLANKSSMLKAAGAAQKAGKVFDEAGEFGRLVDNRVAKVVNAMTAPEVVANVVKANNISAARYATVAGAKITSIEERSLQVINDALTNPDLSPADLVKLLHTGADDTVKTTAKEVGANADEIGKAKALIDDKVKAAIPADDLAEVRAASKPLIVDKPENWGKGSFKAAERFKTIENRRAAVARTTEQVKQVEEILDIDDHLAARMQSRMGKAYFAVGSKFSTHVDASMLRPEEWRNMNMYMGVAHDFNRRLSGIHDATVKTFGPDSRIKIQEAWKAVQTGGEVDELTKPLADQMRSMVNFIDGVAERAGVRAEDVNDFLVRTGVTKQEFKPFTQMSAIDQIKAFEDVDDPLDFMSKVQKAMGDASTYSAVADSFSSLGSKSPGPGLVRITNRAGDSRIHSLIDQSLYYPKEMVTELGKMRKLEQELKTWSKYDNSPAMKVFDKLTRGWKTGMTVIRPGHHARNLFSDVVLTSLDGVTNPRVYQAATRILAKHKGNIKGDGELSYLSSLVSELPDDIKAATGTRVGKTTVSDDAIYQLAFRQGLFPGYQILEDLTIGTKGAAEAGGRVSSNPIRKMVEVGGRVSEWESNYTRMAHFVGAIQQEAKRIKTTGLSDRQIIELAAKRAGDRVRKYHPDGSDLTGFERGVLRRASMFYSWNRKAIPLIAQTALMNPGKVMVLPKASYNLAVSMGVDPESLSNPFPDDQLFPNYITSAFTGPQFKINDQYFRSEPGDPFADMMGDWAGPQAGRTALASMNPFFRIPMELALGNKFQSNTPIQDKSDYIDSQIPIVNTLSSLSNRSITGLGAPKSGNVLGYDSEGQRVEDTSPGPNPLTAINWLSGLGIQGLSKPNIIKNGEYDYRDAVVAANEASRRA